MDTVLEKMPWLGHWKHRFEILGSTKKTIRFECACGEVRAYKRTAIKRVLTTKSIRGRKVRNRDLASRQVAI